MKLQEIDFDALDFHEIGSWPLPLRKIAFVIIGVVAIVASYFIFVNDQITELNTQHNKQISLRKEFKEKYHIAANLNAYKKQMEETKLSLQELLRQLPTDEQIPELMEDISLQATAAGLEFNFIKPGSEVAKEFYNELLIKMSLTGPYHGFGGFISGLSSLPRVVTLHDFSIKGNVVSVNAKMESDKALTMEIDAKTYWCPNRENL